MGGHDSISAGGLKVAIRPPKKLTKPSARVGGFYGGPVAQSTAVGGCPGGASVPNTSSFAFSSAGELRAASGACVVARPLYGPQLWAKPLGGGRVAALVVNLIEQPQQIELPLADVPGLDLPAGATCAIRDVWAQQRSPVRVWEPYV